MTKSLSRINLISLIAVVIIGNCSVSAQDISWDPPPESLLTQRLCPIDGSAAAMVVQKETLYRIEREGKYRVIMFVNKRIKIYSEAGLEYADVTLPYYGYQKVENIEATCYNPGTPDKKLDKNDIHEELWVLDRKKDIRLEAKSFAVPGARTGSVIDISYELCQINMVFLPPYMFHEDIPVDMAEVRVMLPDYFIYHYFITNPELINVKITKRDKNPVMVATAENIPALEDELFRPPTYNISSRLWLKLDKYESPYRGVKIASSWSTLLDYFEVPKDYNEYLDKSDKVRELVLKEIRDCTDTDSIINKLFYKVRDDWTNRLYGYVYKPFDNVDNLLQMETLDAESKATLLCSMLRHAGIPCDVVFVCTRSDRLIDFPSFFIFDHALTYIPSLNIFLDPCDPGSEVGVIDMDYYDRLALNVTSPQHEFFNTSKNDWIDGSMIDISMRFNETGGLYGNGSVTFYRQDAIEARRKFRKLDEYEKREWLNDRLFSNFDEAVDSLFAADDSLQSPEEFRLDFKIEMDDFISPDDDYPEIYIYPGNTFDKIALDRVPPRKYPVFFGQKSNDYYKVVWKFGHSFQPQSWEDISIKKGLSVTGSFAAEYDSSDNCLTVIRQYKNLAAIYKPQYSTKIENVRNGLRQCDRTSIILKRR